MKGKVWKFGNDIDTDIILPGRYLIYTDEEELSKHCMEGLVSDFNLSSLASPSFLALAKSPFLAPYDFATNGSITSFISDADTYMDEILGTKASVANPTAILEYGEANNKNHSDCTMINLAIAPKWQPTKNFFLTNRFSYTMQSFDEAYYTPIKGMPTYRAEGSQAATQNSKYSLYSKHNAVFNDFRADWLILPDGNHHLDLFGGFRFMSDSFTSSYLIGDNTGNDKTPNNSSSQSNKVTRGVDLSWKSLTYYANVDYNYQEKYYLQGQVAFESSSRFGKETKAGIKLFGVPWGIFPSIQGSWVISNENWFQPNKGVNMLKVNVGFESVGNDGLDNSATLTYMSTNALLNNQATSIGLTNIGSPELRWETTNRLNAGIEGNFLNNRLNVKFNYFYAKTSNLIALGTLAYVAGLTDYTYYTNDGALKNQGFDFAFNAKIVDQKNFKFDLGASVGHYKNKLTRLPEGRSSFTTNMYGATILSEVGRSAGVFYGLKTDGVYATSDAAAADGKYILDEKNSKIIVCQSCSDSTELREWLQLKYPNYTVIVNPLGDWTGGPDVDSGATNRKLGSDMGRSVTGGGLHGKDCTKADVSVNIYAFLEAQRTGETQTYCCAIGDNTVNGIPYSEIVKVAKEYIDAIGGFEAFAEWGLI